VHTRRHYGFKKLDNEVIRRLKGVSVHHKHDDHSKKGGNGDTPKRLIGIISYDILENHAYQMLFQYVPSYMESR
jgi:hypothetical protein